MRLGEIKQNIDKVLAKNKTIELKNEPIYQGQAYKIYNFYDVVTVLEHVASSAWGDIDVDTLKDITENHPKANNVELSIEYFNKLTTAVNYVNEKMPLYYSILETMVDRQNEKAINVKLPERIKSLSGLSSTNKKLEDIFKLFNIDGKFEFQGFDKGTAWYVFVPAALLSHQFFISCLRVAQEYFKAKAEYFKSEEARISYEASLNSINSNESFSEEGFNKFKKAWLELFIEKEVKKAIGEIKQNNGHTDDELCTKLVKGTTNLIKELGEGTEFHLSLNPPEYASEQAGKLVIDYKKIQALNPVKDESPKKIEAHHEDITNDNNEG